MRGSLCSRRADPKAAWSRLPLWVGAVSATGSVPAPDVARLAPLLAVWMESLGSAAPALFGIPTALLGTASELKCCACSSGCCRFSRGACWVLGMLCCCCAADSAGAGFPGGAAGALAAGAGLALGFRRTIVPLPLVGSFSCCCCCCCLCLGFSMAFSFLRFALRQSRISPSVQCGSSFCRMHSRRLNAQ